MDKGIFRQKIVEAECRTTNKERQMEYTGLIARVVQSIAEELKEIKILLRERR